MKILGISDGHDSGAAVIQDGKIIAAVAEERLTRIKNEPRFPYLAIQEVLRLSKSTINEMDFVAFPTAPLNELSVRAASMMKGAKKLASPAVYAFFRYYFWKNKLSKIEQQIRDFTKFKGEMRFVDHHMSHAASAYYTSGFRDSLVITMDSGGDFFSSTVNTASYDGIRRIQANDDTGSIGKVWGRLTTIFGMKYCQHEGKVVGLAAYRKTTPQMLQKMRNLMQADGLKFKIGIHTGFPSLSNPKVLDFEQELKDFYKYFEGDDPRDIAPALQQVTEEVTVKLVKNAIAKTGLKDVSLAGGVFANVKVNQRIREIPELDNVFIHPNMGDGGTAAGAALKVWADETLKHGGKAKPYKMMDAYLGPGYSDAEIEAALDAFGVKATKVSNPGKVAGQMIAEKKIISFHQGRMEYGPRALGNRTVMYHPTDKTVNEWLNKNLKRTEFMPFAPVTTEERAADCYKGYSKSPHPARFMTITYDCTDFMKKTQEAVVHIDGTARPQIIDRKTHPFYYDAVKTYEGLSGGIPSVINTSFNMHEEPIVCTPFDSVRAYLASKIGGLIIGNYVVE